MANDSLVRIDKPDMSQRCQQNSLMNICPVELGTGTSSIAVIAISIGQGNGATGHWTCTMHSIELYSNDKVLPIESRLLANLMPAISNRLSYL